MKRYAKDFDPATPVVELCRYSNAVERIAELEKALLKIYDSPSNTDSIIDSAYDALNGNV